MNQFLEADRLEEVEQYNRTFITMHGFHPNNLKRTRSKESTTRSERKTRRQRQTIPTDRRCRLCGSNKPSDSQWCQVRRPHCRVLPLYSVCRSCVITQPANEIEQNIARLAGFTEQIPYPSPLKRNRHVRVTDFSVE